jgi:hypothetical protein
MQLDSYSAPGALPRRFRSCQPRADDFDSLHEFVINDSRKQEQKILTAKFAEKSRRERKEKIRKTSEFRLLFLRGGWFT